MRLLLPVLIVVTSALASAARPNSMAGRRFCASSIAGRFDSDARQDRAIVFSSRRECDLMDGRDWHLVVRLATGRAYRRALGHDLPAFAEGRAGCEPTCIARSAPDFNRDGRHELEVALQEGAYEEQRGVYALVDGRLRRLRGDRGRFSFSYGGSIAHGAFVVCRTIGQHHHVVAVDWGTNGSGRFSRRNRLCVRRRALPLPQPPNTHVDSAPRAPARTRPPLLIVQLAR